MMGFLKQVDKSYGGPKICQTGRQKIMGVIRQVNYEEKKRRGA